MICRLCILFIKNQITLLVCIFVSVYIRSGLILLCVTTTVFICTSYSEDYELRHAIYI